MSKYQGYTEARGRANRAYDAKTYQKINIALRYDEDADIIEAWKEAQAKGITNREWLRKLFERKED